MAIGAGVATTLSIIDTAADVLIGKDHPQDIKVRGKIDRGLKHVARVANAGSALTSLTAQTTILSRVFMDESISGEIVIPNIMRCNHEWYAAQVLSALQLSQMVDSVRSVQDVLTVVQDGHNRRQTNLLGNLVNKRFAQESLLENLNIALEALDYSLTGDEYKKARDKHNDEKQAEKDTEAKQRQKAADAEEQVRKQREHSNLINASFSLKSTPTSGNRIGPVGELYEVKLVNPNGNGSHMTVPLFIQMQPSFIPADIAPRFVDMNVTPTLWQRWTQMRSGEHASWKDLVLNRQQILRNRSMLKDPAKAKAFSEFLKTVSKKDKYALGDASDSLHAGQSHNLANSVVILSEDTVMQAKADSGIDLHSDRDRHRYFNDTYTMIIVIIDPLHQCVTTYFNGMDGAIDAPYSEYRPKDQKFEPKDFMNALQAFSSNNIGRMR